MALLEAQPLRAGASSSGSVQAPPTPVTRSSVSLDLSAGFSSSEGASARLLLLDRNWDRHYDRYPDPYRPGPYRPGPYRPYPPPYYPPRPYPIPIPGYPSPIPGPLPGERACFSWEIGSWGSRQDVFGQWWCRW